MADNYPQFLSSVMAGAEAHAPMSQEEPNHSFLAGQPLPINTVPLNYQNFGHFTGFPGPSFAFQQSISKGRRKSASAAAAETEQVKHRRTRSGCFTCRGRRVKCDEARPICERCRKGGRDCVYPDPSTSKGSSRQKESASTSASTQSPTSSNSEDAEHDDAKRSGALDTIPDEEEDSTSPKHPLKSKLVLQISDRNSRGNYSLSPSSATVTPIDQPIPGHQQPDFHSLLMGDQNLSNLPTDYQLHLQYLYENVTPHHYSLTNDTDNFFIRGMIIEASKNRLLLNAVVAFSSYLRSTKQPDGKLGDFLLYYNRSITLLLECLKEEQTHNLPTLLSILQLATIESLAKTIPREKLMADLLLHSYAVCQLFEALGYWPATPKGVVSGLGVFLPLVSFFLPRDTRHRVWLWRKFALLETMGSIQTLPFRSKIAELFRDDSATRWWLPDDEGFSPMLQSIRNFADERHNATAGAHLDYVQVMGKLFDKLDFGAAMEP
ncbi:hypothetical protein MY4824_006317 [Beauveria thailandica]